MATSVFMAASSDRHHQTTTNSSGPQVDHETHPIRRSSGRRSSKTKGCDSSSSCGQKKNKTPQRGMGVEKLEKLRLQEGWKKMTEINNGFSHGFNAVSTAPFCDLVSKMRGFGSPGGGSNIQMGFQYGQVDPFGLGGSGFVKCYSGHCNACHKKKKFDVGDQCGFLGLNSTIAGGNHEGLDVGTKMTLGNLRKQEVEIVAVHRKGCSSSTEGQVMMEYEFFPSNATKSSDDDDDDGLMTTMNFVGNYPETSTTSSSSATPPGFDRASNSCLDLSLKLSY